MQERLLDQTVIDFLKQDYPKRFHGTGNYYCDVAPICPSTAGLIRYTFLFQTREEKLKWMAATLAAYPNMRQVGPYMLYQAPTGRQFTASA
jgi:hypothetical protein